MNYTNWIEFIDNEFSDIRDIVIEKRFFRDRDDKTTADNEPLTVEVEDLSDANIIYVRISGIGSVIRVSLSIDKLVLFYVTYQAKDCSECIQEAIFNPKRPFCSEFIFEDYDISSPPFYEIEFCETNCNLVSKMFEIPKYAGWREELWYLKNKKRDINDCFRSRISFNYNNNKYIYNNYMVPSYIKLFLTRMFFYLLGFMSYYVVLPFLEKRVIEVKPFSGNG